MSPPGCGKSAFCKGLGNELGRPTLLLDLGALYGSLLGATEGNIRQALRVADAMAPCILFVDEFEKALSGVGGTGDSGVATRLFGTLLTWLSDHTSDVFFVGRPTTSAAAAGVRSGGASTRPSSSTCPMLKRRT